jgi:hypothetical protein
VLLRASCCMLHPELPVSPVHQWHMISPLCFIAFRTSSRSQTCILAKPDGQRLQWRADGSSMRALDSTTETETHHNDGAVSVACDQSQIESQSVARVPLVYISATCKVKSDSASSHIKVPRYFVKGGPRGCGTLQRYARIANGSVRGSGGRELDFQKRGQRRESPRPWRWYLYTVLVCATDEQGTNKSNWRVFWTSWNRRKMLVNRRRIMITMDEVPTGSSPKVWIQRPNDQRTNDQWTQASQ